MNLKSRGPSLPGGPRHILGPMRSRAASHLITTVPITILCALSASRLTRVDNCKRRFVLAIPGTRLHGTVQVHDPLFLVSSWRCDHPPLYRVRLGIFRPQDLSGSDLPQMVPAAVGITREMVTPFGSPLPPCMATMFCTSPRACVTLA